MVFLLLGKSDAGKPRPNGLFQSQTIHVVVGSQAKSTSHLGYVVIELVVVILRWVMGIAQRLPIHLIIAERMGLQCQKALCMSPWSNICRTVSSASRVSSKVSVGKPYMR